MIEVLAPAGTYESFQAAISAGADAVYLGGSLFGARAFAGNFDRDELCRAIEYAHLYDRKVYLTVNTLVKERELQEKLFSYLLPYYERGLDAVIVQDFGVFRFVRRNFPELAIHASTQMTISGHLGAKEIAAAGASRIVTPRELTLREIALIREENPHLEIESFVHGALCYCYSGQCLMSSLIGGRSGNRGRCAQSCRLAHEAQADGKRQNREEERFLLSMRDMCALENLPQVIAAGVNSLKIEGRMKSPEYTAGVVSIYRKYVDFYAKCKDEEYRVSPEDMEMLMDLYNRGNFTKGYYTEAPSKKMMAMERPNHQGVRALEVLEAGKGSFRAKTLTSLNGGDVIEITPEYEITVGEKDAGAKELSFRIPAKFSVKKGQILYRTRNSKLLQKMRKEYLEEEPKKNVEAMIFLHQGEAAVLTLAAGETTVCVSEGLCEKAAKQPLTLEQVEHQMKKFGATRFAVTKITVEMDADIFLPMGVLAQLRRSAAAELELALAAGYYRDAVKPAEFGKPELLTAKKMGRSVYVTLEEQLLPVLEAKLFSRVYLDAVCLMPTQWKDWVEKFRAAETEVYLAFPRIFRMRSEQFFDGLLDVIKECAFDGYLVRSLCEISYVRQNGLAGNIVSDHNLYAWNHEAAEFLREQQVDMLTAPVELNEWELEALNPCGMEIIGYGRYPMMVSAQCVRKNLSGCKAGSDKEKEIWELVDRKGNHLPVLSDCKNCLSTIYNPMPVNLMDKIPVFQKWGISMVRVELTAETAEETRKILSKIKAPDGGMSGTKESPFRGHFTRGVE